MLLPYVCALSAVAFVVWLCVSCLSDASARQLPRIKPPRMAVHPKAEQLTEHNQTQDNDNYTPEAASLLGVVIGLGIIGLVVVVALALMYEFTAAGWTAAFSFILLFCTTAQAIVAHGQIEIAQKHLRAINASNRAARKSARAAEKNARTVWLQQRPWCTYIKIEMGEISNHSGVCTRASIINTGQTPAFIERQGARAFLRPSYTLDLSDEYNRLLDQAIAAPPEYQVVLAPGTDGHVFLNREYESFDDAVIWTLGVDEAIRNKGYTIFLIGFVIYRDAAERMHFTTSCYKWQPEGKNPQIGKFVGHRRHNEMT